LAQSPRNLTPERDARSFFGAELRHWRELRGFSQDRLGTEVHNSGDMVAKIEKALRWPHREFAATCDDVLETGGALGRLWLLVDVERQRVEQSQFALPGAAGQAQPEASVSASGARVLVPPTMPGVVVRPALVEAIVGQLSPTDGDRAARGGVVAVCGPGGFGKTTAATLVCADPRIGDWFSDVLWVETGEHCSPTRLTGLICDLCRHLGRPGVPFDDPEQAGFHLATVLSGRRALLVVDNVWSSADLAPFLVGCAGSVLLVTSRNARTCPDHARVVRLDPMAIVETEGLLACALPGARPPHLRGLARRCGGWPLLAAVVGSSVRQDVEAGACVDSALAAATNALETLGPGAFDVWDADQRATAIGEVLDASLRSLETSVRLIGGKGLRERYLSLAIFPAATPIPIDLLTRWWSHADGWTPAAVRQFCRLLVDRSLVIGHVIDTDAVMLHDVFRTYLRHLAGVHLGTWHSSLLDAHRPASGAWADLDPTWGYLWRHLGYHLHESGRDTGLIQTLASPDFVVTKAAQQGQDSLAGDRAILDTCDPDPADDGELLKAARILTGSGYLLTGLTHRADIAATMLVQCLRELVSPGTDRLRELAGNGDRAPGVDWARHGPWEQTERQTGPGHVGAVTGVAVRGDRLVSVGEDGTVRWWDRGSGKPVRARRGHTGWIYAAAISADGQLVATAGDDGLIRVWRAQTGEPASVLLAHTRRIRALAFTSRGRALVSGGEDGQIRVWDVDSRSPVRDLDTPGVPVWSLAIDPTDTLIAAGGEDRALRLYDFHGGELLDVAEADPDWVRVVAFAHDRPLLASACRVGPIRVWDVSDRSLRPMTQREVPGRVRCAAFTATDDTIVTGTEDATLCLAALSPHDPVERVPPPDGVDWIRAVAVCPDGSIIAGCEDGALRTWEPARPATLHTLTDGANTVWSTALLGRRGLTLQGRGDGLIDVSDAATGQLRQRLTAGKGRVWSLAAEAGYLAATCGDETIRVWDTQDFQPVTEFTTTAGRTWAVALDPAGSRLAASSANGTVRVWELPSGQLLATLQAHSGRIRAMDFDSTGDLLATAGGEGSARVWRLSTGNCVTEITDHAGWVRCVGLDPTGRRLAVGYGPGDIHVHDVNTHQPLARLRGHNGRVLMLAVSSDPDLVISAAADGTVRTWATSTGRQLFQVRVDASLNCAAFDTSTSAVLTGSANGLTAIGVPDLARRREDSQQ
jgi:WD40 repeat protein